MAAAMLSACRGLRAAAVRPTSWTAARGFSAVRIDGRPSEPLISLHDLTFIRGDGAFEVVPLLPSPAEGSIGIPYGLDLHLERLASTANSLRLPVAQSMRRIGDWAREMGRDLGPGSVRIVLTRGQPSKDLPPKVVMLHDGPAKMPDALRLKTIEAPWHFGYALPARANPPPYSQQVGIGAWTTIKWMSYAPNCLMTRVAQENGADDALLLAADGRVLDGPNFAAGFVLGGRLRLVAAAENHLLPSCTQVKVVKAAAAVGLPLEEGCITIDEVRQASAGFAMSATRHVLPIASVDDHQLSPQNAMLCDLQAAYWSMVERDLQAEAHM